MEEGPTQELRYHMQARTGPCHPWDLQVSRVPDQLLRGQDHSPGLRQPTSTSIPGIHATYQCTLAWHYSVPTLHLDELQI